MTESRNRSPGSRRRSSRHRVSSQNPTAIGRWRSIRFSRRAFPSARVPPHTGGDRSVLAGDRQRRDKRLAMSRILVHVLRARPPRSRRSRSCSGTIRNRRTGRTQSARNAPRSERVANRDSAAFRGAESAARSAECLQQRFRVEVLAHFHQHRRDVPQRRRRGGRPGRVGHRRHLGRHVVEIDRLTGHRDAARRRGRP